MSSPHIAANVARFAGFAAQYDQVRPQPPLMVIDILTQVAQVPYPALVVDLGSGTGLSTMPWVGRAAAVVGIEPSADMRQQAIARAAHLPPGQQPGFRDGLSTATGLPDACADIVLASQALHWMEPAPTFAEVGRILRPGGVFAAIDCDWPPTMQWQAEAAYNACMANVRRLEREHGTARDVRHWNKDGHLERMATSGQFRYTRELVLHHVEAGDAERLVGVAMSQGGLMSLLKAGLSEDEIGITALRRAAHAALGAGQLPWYWSYRVRLGVR